MKKLLLLLFVLAFVSTQTCFSQRVPKYKYMSEKQIEKAIADKSIASCFALEFGETIDDVSIAVLCIDDRKVEKRENGIFRIKNTITGSLEYVILENTAIFNKHIDGRFVWFVFELDQNRYPTGELLTFEGESGEIPFGNDLKVKFNGRYLLIEKSSTEKIISTKF